MATINKTLNRVHKHHSPLAGLLGGLALVYVFTSALIGPLSPFQPLLPSPLEPQPAPHPTPKQPAARMPDQQKAVVPTEQPAITSASYPASNLPQLNEKLVRFTSDTARDQFLNVNGLTLADLSPIPELNTYRVRGPHLKETPGVELYGNHTYRAALVPTDTLYSSQGYLSQINLPAAWDNQTVNQAATVAVLDTGFALNHQDLTSQWVGNPDEQGTAINEGPAPNCTSRNLALDKSCNNIDDDSNGLIDDSLGYDFLNNGPNVQAGKTNPNGQGVSHGTMTSGVIGASGNNNRGTTGVLWQSKLLPIQVLDDNGSGSTVSVALGIHYAVGRGARIINLSLGGSDADPLLQEQINDALEHNVVIIAAAGNDGCDCLNYPARYSGVISVGALASNNARASFSNYGNRLDVMAPGVSICSTAWQNANQVSSYACGLAGTSFSAPLTAGVAGLLLSQNPSLTPAQVRSTLINTSKKLSAMNGSSWTTQYGYGEIDTMAALANVSLPTPTGSVINTHTISLSQAPNGVLAYLSDQLNSTCSTSSINAICRIRAIQATSNQIIDLSQAEDLGGTTNLYWQAFSQSLNAGQWLIQTYAVADDIYSMKRQEILTITP